MFMPEGSGRVSNSTLIGGLWTEYVKCSKAHFIFTLLLNFIALN